MKRVGLWAAMGIGLFITVGLLTVEPGYAEKKDHFVPSTNAECTGVPSCLSTTFAAVPVQAGRRQSTRLVCPADHPNFWGWDVAHHENLQIDLVSSETGAATIQGINKSDSDGEFIVTLGCSTERVAGTRLLKSRILGPTEQGQKRKQRTIGKESREMPGVMPLPRSPRPQGPCPDTSA
jgi:hypothetical protein